MLAESRHIIEQQDFDNEKGWLYETQNRTTIIADKQLSVRGSFDLYR